MTFSARASNGEDFTAVSPLGYVPVLSLENEDLDMLAETIVVMSYLADQHPGIGLIPAHGTPERAKLDQLLVFMATEIAQKHIPLMRKLLTPEGIEFTTSKLLRAYKVLGDWLADGRPYLLGDKLTVADAYAWATMWVSRSGVDISQLKHLGAWLKRIEARPSAAKTIRDEAQIVARKAQIQHAQPEAWSGSCSSKHCGFQFGACGVWVSSRLWSFGETGDHCA